MRRGTMTNRELYLAIGALVNDPARARRADLEEYLRALLRGCRTYAGANDISAEQFLAVLERAFVDDPLEYDPAWAAAYDAGITDPGGNELDGFAGFEAVLLRQIVDLREMREAGILDRKWIELGEDAPRGGRWYNFHPRTYLECAAAGSMGGWEPGDDTGRGFVNGEVAVMDDQRNVTSADPRDVDRPVHALGRVTWNDFADFVYCGQVYE
jgi:hypothetical protein